MSYPRQDNVNSVRQSDNLPDYNNIYPVIAGSTTEALPPINTVYQTYPSVNNTNASIPQQKKIRRKSPSNSCKKIGLFVMIIGVIAVIITIIAVVIYIVNRPSASTSSSNEICPEGYSITDCSLECGVIYGSNNYNRIVGGQESTSHTWPSMALVIFRYSAYIDINGVTYKISSSSLCGGTLIDKSTILSAAHCIKSSIDYTHNGNTYTYSLKYNSNYPSLESMYTIYLGVHDRSDLSASGIVTKSVSKIIKHSDYDSYNTLNDIALFKLETEVELNERIQVACLPTKKSNSYPSSSTAYATGWGTLSSGGSSSSVLREVDLTVYEERFCYNVASSYTKNWDSQICAGDWSGNKDTCQGDSGGPLFIKDTVNGKTKFVSVGITSYGIGCAEVATPAIYTRTSYYYDWIRTNNSNKKFTDIYILICCLILAILND